MSERHPSGKILIVGAGPTGLTLALELLRQGVPVRLIEKAPTVSRNAKALGMWPRTLELFAQTRTEIVEELLDLTQQEAGMEVVLRTASGQEEVTRTDWLIGCDGAKGKLRYLVGVPFVGKTFEQGFVAGDVRMQWDFPPDQAHAFVSGGNAVAFFPIRAEYMLGYNLF